MQTLVCHSCHKCFYYSFKIFLCFWLVPRMIHQNQLLWTKFGKNFVLLIWWRQKCSQLQIIELLTEKTWGRGCVIFGEQKNKDRNGETPLRSANNLFWMNNKAIEFGFHRIWRILQISEGVIYLCLWPRWITPSLMCRILHILLSLIR